MTAMDDCPRCKQLRDEKERPMIPTMTETANLARALMDEHPSMTMNEVAVLCDREFPHSPRFYAAAVWLRAAALWGTVDLDRNAAYQDEEHR